MEGRHVARGYLNNDAQTAKAFIQSAPGWTRHPGFPEALPYDRMYRTGDLVRHNSNGTISYVSRKDTQIKLNGRRIELGEIEFHCRSGLPENTQVALEVVVPPSNNAQSTTKALAVFFAVPSQTHVATGGEFSPLPMTEQFYDVALALEAHVTSQLPTYMVPQLFVRLDHALDHGRKSSGPSPAQGHAIR